MSPQTKTERVVANAPETLAGLIAREVAKMATDRLFSETIAGSENPVPPSDGRDQLMAITVHPGDVITLVSQSNNPMAADKPRPVPLDRNIETSTVVGDSDMDQGKSRDVVRSTGFGHGSSEAQSMNQPTNASVTNNCEENLQYPNQDQKTTMSTHLGAFRTTWFAPPVGQASNSDNDVLEFEGSEHQYLGDMMNLMGVNTIGDGEAAAFSVPLIKISGENFSGGRNDVWLTYGQICALAGDFYGTFTPISNGKGPEERRELFKDAWETLVNNPQDQPADVCEILDRLNNEKEVIWGAYKSGKKPSEIYGTDTDLTDHEPYQTITKQRKCPKLPTYLALASLNVDHFGSDALSTYVTGHKWAIEVAAQERTVENLKYAYAINAFADHFLQDLFSAGHLRTPRRAMHWDFADSEADRRKWNELADDTDRAIAKGLAEIWATGDTSLCRDLLAKAMHDEESAIGLNVCTGDSEEKWTCYGDKRLFDPENAKNMKRCQSAVEASAREVYEAWSNQTVTGSELDYEVFKRRPYVEDSTPLTPLFKVDDSDPQEWARVKIRRRWLDRQAKEHSITWPPAQIAQIPPMRASVGILLDTKVLPMFQYPGIQDLNTGI